MNIRTASSMECSPNTSYFLLLISYFSLSLSRICPHSQNAGTQSRNHMAENAGQICPQRFQGISE